MIFASGLDAPEGPVPLPDGTWLAVETGLERGCVTHIGPDGQRLRVLARTGRPNGLAVDRDGVIWVAESLSPPSLIRLTSDGAYEVFLTGCDGEPFLYPNDLAFGPDGALYLTDSGARFEELMRIRQTQPEREKDLPLDGRVYRIDTRTGAAKKLDSGLRFANGIAFGPDGRLYVSETRTGNIYRYRWEGGEVGPRELFANVVDPAAVPAAGLGPGPDGMKFAADGNLYVAVHRQSDVTVLAPNGSVVRRIRTRGSRPTNVAFAPPGQRRLHVTEMELGNIEAFDVGVDGFPLYG